MSTRSEIPTEAPQEDEEWRPIPGYEHYEASNLGRIRSVERYVWALSRARIMVQKHMKERVLKGCLHRNGYRTVQLPRLDGQEGWRHMCVNRLVYAAFVRPPRDDEEIDHIDRVRDNNRIDNLQPLSVAANRALRTYRLGSLNHNCKLDVHKVREIRAAAGRHHEIASRYGVSRQSVGLIKNRKVWAHLT